MQAFGKPYLFRLPFYDEESLPSFKPFPEQVTVAKARCHSPKGEEGMDLRRIGERWKHIS